MTSAPQQPGWTPAEEPPAQPGHGGFDLFEAPPVPDSFPVFTPFREEQPGEPDYPHDQSPAPFSGFPESSAAEQYTPESYSPEPYNPEPYTPESYTPTPLLSEQSNAQPSEPYVPAPAAMPIPGVTHDVAGSWPAFSASKPADPPSDNSDSFPAAEPYEPYSAADHEPVQWTPIQWPSSTEPASPEPEPEPAVSWPSASNDPAPEPVQQAPVSPAPVAEAAAVVATARVSAASAVPAVNRATPDEIPATLPKPAPRVYGRPAQAEPEPVAAETPPQPPTPDAEQQARGAARAAVPQARSPQEEAVRPPIARSSTVYGAPARPAEQEAASAPMAAPQRQSSFSDLIPQAAPAQAAPPMQAMPPQGAPPMGARPASMGPMPTGGQGQPPMGALPPQNSPAVAPPMVPAQRGPAQMADEPSIAIETKPVRSGRLVVFVIGGCVALLAVAFGVLFAVSKLIGGGDDEQFKVSSCVKQTGGQAAVANCSEADTFTIISIETDVAKCADKTQPYVKYGTQVLCLRANK